MSNVISGPKGPKSPTTYLAGAAIVYGTGVKRGADANTVIPATAASANIGVATDDQPTVGRTVPVAHRPGEMVEVRAGAAFALDALLTTDAAGKFITAATTNPVTAVARQAATAVDQLVPAEIVGPRVLAP
jgi:hypothetical protein